MKGTHADRRQGWFDQLRTRLGDRRSHREHRQDRQGSRRQDGRAYEDPCEEALAARGISGAGYSFADGLIGGPTHGQKRDVCDRDGRDSDVCERDEFQPVQPERMW